MAFVKLIVNKPFVDGSEAFVVAWILTSGTAVAFTIVPIPSKSVEVIKVLIVVIVTDDKLTVNFSSAGS